MPYESEDFTGRIIESGVGKRSHAGLTVLDDIGSSTKGFTLMLSKVLVARERSLSLTYGRPDESCSSFTLMYFGKRRASWINLSWSRWISLMIVSEVVMVEREPGVQPRLQFSLIIFTALTSWNWKRGWQHSQLASQLADFAPRQSCIPWLDTATWPSKNITSAYFVFLGNRSSTLSLNVAFFRTFDFRSILNWLFQLATRDKHHNALTF